MFRYVMGSLSALAFLYVPFAFLFLHSSCGKLEGEVVQRSLDVMGMSWKGEWEGAEKVMRRERTNTSRFPSFWKISDLRTPCVIVQRLFRFARTTTISSISKEEAVPGKHTGLIQEDLGKPLRDPPDAYNVTKDDLQPSRETLRKSTACHHLQSYRK